MNQNAVIQIPLINLSERIFPSKATQWFFIFCVFHFLVWTLIPTFVYSNPPTDSVEGIAWGHLWLLGYEKHPFLAPWITAFFTDLVGTVGWPIYFLSQLSIVMCFWAVWRLGNKILTSPWHVLIAIVLLEGMSYYTSESSSFNPNLLMLPLWGWASLVFYNAVTEKKLMWWLSLAVLSGLAMLAKYESALLFIVMLLVLISTEEGRAAFKQPGLYLAVLISIIVFSPNLYWLAQHHFDAVVYAAKEMNTNKLETHSKFIADVLHPLRFLIEQIGQILPCLLLYIPFYQRNKKSQLKKFDQRFLLLMGLAPLTITLLISILTNATLVSRWAFPFFSLTGLLWVAYMQPLITEKKLKIFGVMIVGWNILLLIGTLYIFIWSPYFTGKAKHYEEFPGKTVAVSLTKQWHDRYHNSLPYIASIHSIAVNISAFSSDRPIPYFNWSKTQSPWINENEMLKKGALFVFKMRDATYNNNMLHLFQERFPRLIDPTIQTFNKETKANVAPIKLWVAFLPPQQKIN
jgi:4-amino-4-deoxy-L-arabinose transferase-like glycosyltransferase